MAQSSEELELPSLKIDLSSQSCSAGLASRSSQDFLLAEFHGFLFASGLASRSSQDFLLADIHGLLVARSAVLASQSVLHEVQGVLLDEFFLRVFAGLASRSSQDTHLAERFG